MPVANQRGAPVVYVAGSARELPAEVQDWLSRADTRAVASPHLYDMLAQLARGKKFAAIVININSVDWGEMSFFDHAGRLSRTTPIFVSGSHQQRAKLEAACRRGARLFNAFILDEELRDARLPQSPRTAVSPQALSLSAAEEWLSAGADEEVGVEPRSGADARDTSEEAWPSADASADAERPRSLPVQSRAGWAPRVKLVESFDQVPEDVAPVEQAPGPEQSSAPEQVEQDQRAPGCEQAEVLPVDREPAAQEQALGTEDAVEPKEATAAEMPTANATPEAEQAACAPEQDAAPIADEQQEPTQPAAAPTAEESQGCGSEDQGAPIVFPWTVNPDRPKRTPPHAAQNELPDPPSASPPALEASASPFRSVRLTAEEIAALMGPNPRRQSPEAPQ